MFDFSHEQLQLQKILSSFKLTSCILDVGCGTGRNLDLFRKLGFRNITGVDANEDLVEVCRSNGHTCLTLDQIKEDHQKYDLLIMSHIVEHFAHKDLIDFLSYYLRMLKPGGHLLIASPLMNKSFYNDFDHIKPYLPMGFTMVYGEKIAQVSFQANEILNLCDLHFFRDQWRLRYYRCFYLNKSNSIPIWINRLFKIIFIISRGNIGYKIGWLGLYKYKALRRVTRSLSDLPLDRQPDISLPF
jgi:SAM-dependent methyltransferase